MKRLAEELAPHLRHLVTAGVSEAALDLPDHELRQLRQQAAGAEPAELTRLFDLVHGTLPDVARASQPRHALELALLKAVYLAPSASVQSRLSRADQLARRLAGGISGAGGGPGGGGAGVGGAASGRIMTPPVPSFRAQAPVESAPVVTSTGASSTVEPSPTSVQVAAAAFLASALAVRRRSQSA